MVSDTVSCLALFMVKVSKNEHTMQGETDGKAGSFRSLRVDGPA